MTNRFNQIASRIRSLIPVLLIAVLMTSCLRSNPSHFFTLEPVINGESKANKMEKRNVHATILGIGPIRLPGYMNRPQIVTRLNNNEVHISEFNRWASPVANRIPTVLQNNLAALLPAMEVTEYSLHQHLEFTFQAIIDIVEFIGQPNGDVVLKARWIFVDKSQGGTESRLYAGSYTRKAKDKTHNSVVSAMTELLGDLSKDIAKTVPEATDKDTEKSE
jgi:uncharacterized lipoprotein YmbA